MNTNVWRAGGGDNYEANVTGGLFSISNKKNTYSVDGGAALSQKYFTNFKNPEFGFQTSLSFQKISGNFNFGVEHTIVSDQYDHNDLGFLRRNNTNNVEGFAVYNIFKPFGKFLNMSIGSEMSYQRLYKPSAYRRFSMNPFFNATFKNWMSMSAWVWTAPFGSNDYDDPREDGRFYDMPGFLGAGGSFSTDRRKKIYLQANYGAGTVFEKDRWFYRFGLRPFFIISDKWRMDYRYNYRHGNYDTGYVEHWTDDDIIFGRRNIDSYENVLSASYIFTNRMGLTLRARHNWTKVVYQKYHLLDQDGSLRPTTYDGIDEDGIAYNNTSFNAVNLDLIYNWEFTPGSRLIVVWKNNIIKADNDTDISFFRNFGETVTGDQSNFFSVKLLYFLDYLSLKKA